MTKATDRLLKHKTHPKECMLCHMEFYPLQYERTERPVCHTCQTRIARLAADKDDILCREIDRLNEIIEDLKNGPTRPTVRHYS